MIEVLDHGYVALVDTMGSDVDIANAARVSYNNDAKHIDKEKDRRLIHRLMRDKHTSPFEAVEFSFEIKAPIFVLRQWMRHRTWSYNEVSGRYTEFEAPEFYIPALEDIGAQNKINKQGRDTTGLTFGESLIGRDIIGNAVDDSSRRYMELIELGVSRELARLVLPLNTYTRMYAKVDLRNLLHFLDLRLDPHAQWEIQQYAHALLDLIRPIVPVTVEAWENLKEPINV